MEENTNTNASTDTKPRELRRTRQGRMIAGVCSGAAEYLGVDANILRLVLAGLTIISGGAGAAIYVAAWLLIPEEGESDSIVQGLINKQEQKKQRQSG
jgi:phage shock protein PspC (stress-responsive transcriptional regulator)